MSAQSKRDQREKLKANGMSQLEIWVLPENKCGLKNAEEVFRDSQSHQLLIEFESYLLNGLHEKWHKNKWGKNRDFELEERIEKTMEIIRKLCKINHLK